MSDKPNSEPLYLSLGLADGTEHRLAITPPRDGQRLAGGCLDRHSSIWPASARRNDLCSTAAGLDLSMKLPIHESGV